MAAINIISVSETQTEGRYDAEFFHPKYNHLDSVLESIESDKLNILSNFIKKGIFDISPKKYRESGVPLIRTTQIKTPITNKDNLIFIEEQEHIKNHSKTELTAGDIVFTKIGAGIGDVAILSKEFDIYNFSQNVAGISIRKEKIDPYYLLAFLISENGKEQILRFMMPSGQGKLELKDIKKIKIFRNYFEKEIAQLIKNSESLIIQSQTLYTQATQLIEQELGLDKISFEKPRSYTTRFSEVINGKRADGEFYNPELRSYYNHFSNVVKMELKPLTQFTKVLKFSNPDYANVGIPIITQKHLTNISPEGYSGFPIASEEWVNKNPTAVVRENDLLFYSVGAYLGKTNIWFNDDKAVHASFITMLRSDSKYDAGYLMVLLNSKFGILQSKVFQSGSSQPYIYPKDIRQFLVPEVNESLKKELYELIRSSYDAKIESQRLLEQAKTRVEELIEQSIEANA